MTAPSGETVPNKIFTLSFSPFKIGSDGIITDTRTGLEWAPAPNEGLNHQQAKDFISKLRTSGGGWKLPTLSELKDFVHTAEQSNCDVPSLCEADRCSIWTSEDCPGWSGRMTYVGKTGTGLATFGSGLCGDPNLARERINNGVETRTYNYVAVGVRSKK